MYKRQAKFCFRYFPTVACRFSPCRPQNPRPNAEDIKPYIDPIFENNVLLTQTELLMMSSRPKHPKYARNKNVLVIGGSGSGKTRFFVKPNLMQMHSSYVVTDPKGTVLIECGKLLQRGGYKIKVLNTINFKKSMRYNPFAYRTRFL